MIQRVKLEISDLGSSAWVPLTLRPHIPRKVTSPRLSAFIEGTVNFTVKKLNHLIYTKTRGFLLLNLHFLAIYSAEIYSMMKH